MLKMSGAFLRDLWTLTRPYWFSEDRWAARGLLAVILAMNLGLVYLNVLFNGWYRLFYNSLQNYNEAAFWHQLGRFCILAAIYIVVGVYQLYLRQMLQIRWRQWLTGRYLKDWLSGQTYYRMQLRGDGADNPDQRIAEDLNLFVSQTLSLTLDFIRSAVTLGSFVVILWTISGAITIPIGGMSLTVPGYMVWAALVYAIFGTWLTHLIGRPLVRLNYNQQRFEADFRFGLVRFRENTEGVALYRGEVGEEAVLQHRFGSVVRNWWNIMRRQKSLGWFTFGYGQAAVVFPYLVSAPRYFSHAIELGQLMQIGSAFNQVQSALSWFVEAYTSLASWKATVDRLTGFEASMAKAQAATLATAILRSEKAGPGFVLENVALSLPRGEPLVSDVDLELRPGESVLVAGPSGSGKSTLFRALAGIWPFGSGAIRIPSGARAFFLPQKPYLPLGTLRSVVSYPEAPRPDGELREALALVGLGALGDRLDDEQSWSLQLSPGEQQRLAVARALLIRPDWLFLDEATSALDEASEAALYKLLRERLPQTTLVSIGHRTTLAHLHVRHLALQRDRSGTHLVETMSMATATAST